jgi:hypothetical protein
VGSITAAGTLDVARLMDALLNADGRAALKLLAPLELPGDDPLTGLGFMAEGGDVENRLVGLQCLAHYVRVRGDVRLSAELSLALVDAFAKLDWFDPSTPIHRRLAVANVLDACANCLTDGGRVPELLERGAQWSEWLAAPDLAPQWRSVQRAWVEACFHAGFYESAARILEGLERRFPDCRESPIERRLFDKLDDVLRPVDRPDAPAAGLDWTVKHTLKEFGLTTLAEKAGELTAQRAATMADQIGALIGLGPVPAELTEFAEAVETLPQAANPLLQAGNVITAFTNFLASGNASYPVLASLSEKARRAALRYGFWEHACTLGWYRTVALRRSGAMETAAASLAELRDAIRERQLGVRQPVLRAALAEYLPHLAAVSAEVLFGLGREAELFEAMEGAKGRVLEALICERHGHASGDPVLGTTRALLEDSPQPACYLTFLVDDECTYAVAVARDGRLHASRLGVGRAVLASAEQELGFAVDGEPGSLTREAGIDPDRPEEVDFAPALSALAPLAQWLDRLFDDDVLPEGAVVCMSLDGPLYGFPLAALEVGGAPLIERAAVAVVPCASVLRACAANRPRSKHARGFAVSVPRSAEFESGMYGPELYERDAQALRARWPTARHAGETDPNSLLREQLSDAVVHIGSHGTFAALDPLNRSGVVLASGGRLPGEQGYDAAAGLLTPNMAARLKAKGAHVTLRACVSGKTTQVSSREALGMIWALFQAGSPSVVAASWHVDVRSGAQMLAHFYAELARLHSAPLALRSAALAIRKTGGTWRHPYHYAAFNAYGHWSATRGTHVN